MRFLLCFALTACVASFQPAFAVDATFGPALVTNPTGTAQAPTPVVITAPAPVIVQASWLDSAYMIASSPAFLAGLAYLVIKLETFLQAKTKLNLARATGVAHSLFNTLFDLGLITNGKFRDAEEAFFQNFNTQYFNAYGKQPDDATQDLAHSHFVQMFTANTGDVLPAKA